MVLAFVIGIIGFSHARENPVVVIKTNMGDIYVELYPDKAPLTVKNFLTYVKEGFYNGTIFHRVVKGFVIQGGGFDKDLNYKKPTHPPIKNESNNGLSNVRGTIAMARTSDPHSANTQFFINLADNTYLDYGKNPQKWGYTVFGKVIKGMDVVDEIAELPVVNIGWMMNVPVKPVIIEKIEIVKPAKK
ncbi:peptidylprolyl isomerase [Persephonella sp.]|uniref:peptidylprolyl isomerase n=1 Tax=Persephonella sp. TaxID=2060922 RepID=UPI0031F2DE3C